MLVVIQLIWFHNLNPSTIQSVLVMILTVMLTLHHFHFPFDSPLPWEISASKPPIAFRSTLLALVHHLTRIPSLISAQNSPKPFLHQYLISTPHNSNIRSAAFPSLTTWMSTTLEKTTGKKLPTQASLRNLAAWAKVPAAVSQDVNCAAARRFLH